MKNMVYTYEKTALKDEDGNPNLENVFYLLKDGKKTEEYQVAELMAKYHCAYLNEEFDGTWEDYKNEAGETKPDYELEIECNDQDDEVKAELIKICKANAEALEAEE